MTQRLPAHGGMPMTACGLCARLVPVGYGEIHDKWHADINELFFKMGETAVDIRRLQAPGEPGE